MSPRVKICGLTRVQDAEAARAAGADYLGFVFAESSPRRVDDDALDEWLEAVRGGAEVVGVFRDATFDGVLAAIDRFDLDFVQLHGRESGLQWKQLPVRMIEARVVSTSLPPSRFAGAAWAQLLDAGAGEGRVFDWKLAGELSRGERVFLAGGLNADNVGDAIACVQPFAVDVASGVEASPGVKDHELIRRFIENAKGATPGEQR